MLLIKNLIRIGMALAVLTFSCGQASAALPTIRTANCNTGATIQALIDSISRAQPLHIEITGTCKEDIIVNRDDLILRGNTIGLRNATITGTITVDGADRVKIADLKIENSASYGIVATRGASIRVKNVLAAGHPDGAVAVLRQSFARIDDSRMVGTVTSEETLVIADASSVRMFNSEIVAVRSELFSGSAIALYRNSTARIDGGNSIKHSKGSADPRRALAVVAMDNSNLRIQKTGNTIIGNIGLETNSTADVREVVIAGHARLSGGAILQLHTGGGIEGAVLLQRRSMLEIVMTDTAGVKGLIKCSGGSAAAGATAALKLAPGCAVLP